MPTIYRRVVVADKAYRYAFQYAGEGVSVLPVFVGDWRDDHDKESNDKGQTMNTSDANVTPSVNVVAKFRPSNAKDATAVAASVHIDPQGDRGILDKIQAEANAKGNHGD